ncbi:hypothetical protein GCM10009772_18790 [Pseudonocardia alni subsp. carboxydivorans]
MITADTRPRDLPFTTSDTVDTLVPARRATIAAVTRRPTGPAIRRAYPDAPHIKRLTSCA